MHPDFKTLRLSVPNVSDVDLDRYETFQAHLLEQRGPAPASEAQGADAHAAALNVSGLNAAQAAQLASIVADFCARRWTTKTLAKRREALAARATVGDLNEREKQQQQRLEKEWGRVSSLAPLEHRYGEPLVARLMVRESALLALHEAGARAGAPVAFSPLKA